MISRETSVKAKKSVPGYLYVTESKLTIGSGISLPVLAVVVGVTPLVVGDAGCVANHLSGR
jgi:hypothetical protein